MIGSRSFEAPSIPVASDRTYHFLFESVNDFFRSEKHIVVEHRQEEKDKGEI